MQDELYETASDELYRELLQRLQVELEVLPDKPDETAEATLHCLWTVAGGVPLSIGGAESGRLPSLDDQARQELQTLIDKRLGGTPLAHITGRQHFMGLTMLASPAALVPRRETELLARTAVNKLHACKATPPLAVDLCTGAGNVALALAMLGGGARVWGSDVSGPAVELARQNAAFLDRPDVMFHVGDLIEPFDIPDFHGRVDLVTCNPPYISSAKVGAMPAEISDHEPRTAFDGGPFGIRIIQRLIQDAPKLLKPTGWLVFEVGRGQGEALQRRMSRLDTYGTVEGVTDADGVVRVIAAQIQHLSS